MLTGLDDRARRGGAGAGRAGRGAARHDGRLEHAAAEAGRALRADHHAGVPRRAGDRAAAHAGDVRPALGQARAAGRPALPRARSTSACWPTAAWRGAVDLDAVRAAGRFFAAEGIASVAICFLNSYANPAQRTGGGGCAGGGVSRARRHRLGGRAARGGRVRADLDHGGQRLCAAGARAAISARLEERLRALRRAGAAADRELERRALGGGGGAGEAGLLHLLRAASSGAVGARAAGRGPGRGGPRRLRHGRHHRLGGADPPGRAGAHARVRVPRRALGAGALHQGRRLHDAGADGGRGRGRQRRRLDRRHRRRGAAHASARSRPAPIPGPVCYGMGGTEPTVTDANVVLGLPAAAARRRVAGARRGGGAGGDRAGAGGAARADRSRRRRWGCARWRTPTWCGRSAR